MIIVSLGQRQLGEDAVYVLFDCAPRLSGDACIGAPLSQQLSDPVTVGQQFHRVPDLDVRGEQQDRDVRKSHSSGGKPPWAAA
jgi:hypothetical protein